MEALDYILKERKKMDPISFLFLVLLSMGMGAFYLKISKKIEEL